MNNIPIILIIAIILFVFLFMSKQENFSSSGLNMSNRYCQKLADIYHRPHVTEGNEAAKHDFRERICGLKRRSTIDNITGNYFMYNGVLV